MNGTSPTGDNVPRLDRVELSPEVARKVFEFDTTPSSGTFTVGYTDTAKAIQIQQRIREAQEEEQRARQAQQAQLRAQAKTAEAQEDAPKKRAFTMRRVVGGLVVGALVWGPSFYEEFHDNDETTPKVFLEDVVTGLYSVAWNDVRFGNKVGKWISAKLNNDPQNSTAVAVAETSPTAEPTILPSKPAEPSPTPSPELKSLPEANDIASIQSPQVQPFTYKYGRDKNGDIRGLNGYYKASSGITAEEVQWIESCGNTTNNVLLGFDDTGSEERIRAIARILKENKVGAIFFLNTKSSPDGGAIAPSQELIDDLRNDGFYVGNHSASHPDMTKLSETEIREEIVAGGPSNLVRLPFGGTYKDVKSNKVYVDANVLKTVIDTDAAICGWTSDLRDWSKGATPDSIVNTVKNDLREGANFLLSVHDDIPTLAALPKIFTVIKDGGYTLCPLAGKPTSPDFSKTKICVPAKQ